MSAVAAALCVLQLVNPRETKSVQMIFGVFIVGCTLCGLAYDPSHACSNISRGFCQLFASIPLSAIAYFLCKGKCRAVLSLVIITFFVVGAVSWAIVAAPPSDEMWP